MEWENYPGFQCSLCIDCWSKNCHIPITLNDMQSYIMNDLGNLFVYFRKSSQYVSFERRLTKVLASWPWPIKTLDLTLNITFIQLFTRHNCFSLAHFNLIFFCLRVIGNFRLVLLYVNVISFSWFRTVVSQTLIIASIQLFFIWFVVHSIFSMPIALSLFILTLWCFSLSTFFFPFLQPDFFYIWTKF